jgi:hypothetical protein
MTDTKKPEKKIIGEDNICPETGEPCLDECCPPGSECNISGSGNYGPLQLQSENSFTNDNPKSDQRMGGN